MSMANEWRELFISDKESVTLWTFCARLRDGEDSICAIVRASSDWGLAKREWQRRFINRQIHVGLYTFYRRVRRGTAYDEAIKNRRKYPIKNGGVSSTKFDWLKDWRKM